MDWMQWAGTLFHAVGSATLVAVVFMEVRHTRKVRAAVWTNPELDTVTSDRLFRELARRHDGCVFVARKDMNMIVVVGGTVRVRSADAKVLNPVKGVVIYEEWRGGEWRETRRETFGEGVTSG